jgi:uncharacterized BrkB/YihY/UPF0761 family membrane protein
MAESRRRIQSRHDLRATAVVSGLPHSFYTWQREVRIGESASATAFWVLIAFGPAGLVAMLMRGLRRGYGMPIAPFLLVRAIASLAGLVSIIALGLLAFSIDMASTTQQVIGITCASILAFALILGLHALAVGRAFPWRNLWPGAAFSAIALALIQLLWERAASFSPNASPQYGAIAGLVTSMIAVWLAAFSILIGAYVNRMVQQRRGSESQP